MCSRLCFRIKLISINSAFNGRELDGTSFRFSWDERRRGVSENGHMYITINNVLFGSIKTKLRATRENEIDIFLNGDEKKSH